MSLTLIGQQYLSQMAYWELQIQVAIQLKDYKNVNIHYKHMLKVKADFDILFKKQCLKLPILSQHSPEIKLSEFNDELIPEFKLKSRL